MSLDSTKKLLSKKYLGRGGIHGIGLWKAKRAVRVHLCRSASSSDAEQSALLEELKRDAAPYEIVVTMEEPPVKAE